MTITFPQSVSRGFSPSQLQVTNGAADPNWQPVTGLTDCRSYTVGITLGSKAIEGESVSVTVPKDALPVSRTQKGNEAATLVIPSAARPSATSAPSSPPYRRGKASDALCIWLPHLHTWAGLGRGR